LTSAIGFNGSGCSDRRPTAAVAVLDPTHKTLLFRDLAVGNGVIVAVGTRGASGRIRVDPGSGLIATLN
jgi:hypothetical protein